MSGRLLAGRAKAQLVITGLGMVALFRPRHLGEEEVARDAAPRVPQQLRHAVARVLGRDAAQSKQPVSPRDTEAALVAARDAEQTAVARDVPTSDTVAEQRGAELAEQTVTSGVPRSTDVAPTEPIAVPLAVETAARPIVYREAQPAETVERHDVSRGTTSVAIPERDAVSRDTEADYIAEQDDEFARLASHLVDAGRTQAPVEMAAAVLRGAARGVTVRELADATGISPSGVSRITKAAKKATAELATTGA